MHDVVDTPVTISDDAASERGATTVFVAISLIGLLALTAFSFDFGRIYIERSELQAGADAIALAVASDCAAGACVAGYDPLAFAEVYADGNAMDGFAHVESVDIDLDSNSVTVVIRTEDSQGNRVLPMMFAPIVGVDEVAVSATASAGWGSPGEGTTTPLIFSECEWQHFGIAGMVPVGFLHDKADIPFTGSYGYDPVTIYFHGKKSPRCHGNSSGQDLPGGFGWLDTDSGCGVHTVVDGWVSVDPGSSPSQGCDPDDFDDSLGTVQMIPYFDKTSGNGKNAQYRVMGYGALYVTGYYFAGQDRGDSIIDGKRPCKGSDRCIEGYFIGNWTVPPGSGGGPDLGVFSLGLTG